MSLVVCGLVLAGFLAVWALRNSEGATLWALRAVLLAMLVAAGAIGAMDGQTWPQNFQIAEHR